MGQKNINVVSINTDNMLYVCDDGNKYPLMDRLLTLKETGKLLNVSKQTLQRWDNSGKLIAIRTEGGHRRYKLSDIEKIMNNKIECPDKEIIRKILYMYNGYNKPYTVNDETIIDDIINDWYKIE